MNRDTQQHVPEAVRQAIIQVCRDAFHWRNDVRSIFLRSGVPKSLYDRHDVPGNGKALIARHVLDDLDDLGPLAAPIERRIVEELCHWQTPHRDAPDQKAGLAALSDLKRHAASEAVLVDPQRAAAQQRRVEADRMQRENDRYRQQLTTIRDRFAELGRERRRTQAELQRRGYDFELLLADLFDLGKVTYRRPYRSTHEQHDGSFNFRGFTYIVEAKWRKDPPGFGDMATFKAKVDGKLESVRGLFVAIAGFDENTVDHLFNVARGSRNNLILMDRGDLIEILEERVSLTAGLTSKIDAAEQEGKWWHPLHL